MKIEFFNSLWVTAFGWNLGDGSGLTEWAEFVDSPKSNDKALRECIKEYTERYLKAKRDGRSNYREVIPTLAEFKDYYYATMQERKVKWAQNDNTANGVCKCCGGDGHAWGLVEQKGHEAEAPEHVMEIAQERLSEVYYGVQGYDCPVCRAAAYKDNAYRERVRRNTLPEYIPVGDPNNPHDYPECGARVLLDVLKARIDAAKGAPARVVDAPGLDSLEAMFPLHSTVKTQIDIDEEERRITAEMAGKFGPR